jgi:tetratricopeptide (TPR) repeat protein
MKRSGLPGERELLAGVLDDALAFYGGAAEIDAHSDTEVREDTAQTLYQLGELRAYLGRTADAADSFRKAAELYEQFSPEESEPPERLFPLGRCYNVLACTLPGAERLHYAEKALAVREEVHRRLPDSAEARADLAQSHHNLAVILQYRGPTRRAEEQYERAIAVAKQLREVRPNGSRGQFTLAQSYCNLGLIYHNTDRADKQYAPRRRRADEFYREAESLVVPLARAAPRYVEYHRTLAVIRLNWGNLLLETGRGEAALAIYGRGIEAMEDLLRKEPGYSAGRHVLLQLHGARAQAREGQGRFAEAVADWDWVVELAEDADRPRYRFRRAFVRLRAKDHKAAVQEADELAAAPECTSNMLYNIACVYALAGQADKAVGALSKLHERGYFEKAENLANLRSDADLDSLRWREDFVRLTRNGKR